MEQTSLPVGPGGDSAVMWWVGPEESVLVIVSAGLVLFGFHRGKRELPL